MTIIHLQMRLTVFYRFNTGSYSFFLINFTKNICKDIKWGEPNYKPDIELSMVFNAFKTYSDIIRPCPYQVCTFEIIMLYPFYFMCRLE